MSICEYIGACEWGICEILDNIEISDDIEISDAIEISDDIYRDFSVFFYLCVLANSIQSF